MPTIITMSSCKVMRCLLSLGISRPCTLTRTPTYLDFYHNILQNCHLRCWRVLQSTKAMLAGITYREEAEHLYIRKTWLCNVIDVDIGLQYHQKKPMALCGNMSVVGRIKVVNSDKCQFIPRGLEIETSNSSKFISKGIQQLQQQ